MRPLQVRILRWLLAAVVGAAALAGLALIAFDSALARLPGYQQQVVARVRAETGLRLSVDGLDARLGLGGPEIFFAGAQVLSADGGDLLIRSRAGRVRIALLASLLHRRLEVDRFTLEAPEFGLLIAPDGRVEPVGLADLLRPDPTRRPFTLERVPEGRFAVRDARVRVLDLRGARPERRRVDGLDLSLQRHGDEVQIAGRLELPPALGSTVSFRAVASGELARWDALDWRLSVGVARLDFGAWHAHLPRITRLPHAGRGGFELAAEGKGAQPARATLALDFTEVALPATGAGAAASFQRVAARAALIARPSGWTIDARRLLLQRAGHRPQPTTVTLAATRAGGRLTRIALQSPALELADLAPFAALAPPSRARDTVLALAPRGRLEDVEVALVPRRGRPPALHGRMKLRGLGFEPRDHLPGLDGLDADIAASGAAGMATVATRRLAFVWPYNFRDRIDGGRLTMRAGWRVGVDGWRLWADELALDLGDARVQARLRLFVPADGSGPLLDLGAQVADLQVGRAWRYMPVSRFKPGALGWMDAAFRGGAVKDARVVLTGALRRFPFRDGGGVFDVDARLRGLELHYLNGWPPARRLDLDARFHNEGLRTTLRAGSVGGIRLDGGALDIADWRDNLLAARLPASGDLGAALALVQATPLGPQIGPLFMSLSGRGPFDGEVVLALPLKDMAARSITVVLEPRAALLRSSSVEEPLEQFSGRLVVRNTDVFATGVAGQWLGGPVRVGIDTRGAPDGARQVLVDVRGRLAGGHLQRLAQLPLNAGLDGSADWHGTIALLRPPGGGEARVTARAQTDLAGIASALPAPFDKAAAERRTLGVDVVVDHADRWSTRWHYADVARAALVWERGPRGLRITRGQVRLGAGAEPEAGAEPGLAIAGEVPRVSLTALLALRYAPGSGERAVRDWLRAVDLRATRAEVLGQQFEQVQVSLRPGSFAWRAEVQGPTLAGVVSVPYEASAAHPLAIDLERAHIAAAPATTGDGAVAASPTDPRELPPIRFDARSLVLDRVDFGHVTAVLERAPDGLVATTLEARHPAFTARGSGAWRQTSQGARCSAVLDVQSDDLLGFMRAMGYAPVIAGKGFAVRAELTWPGAPDGSFYERMSGRIRVESGAGELLKVDPGAGRALALMSLGHLWRRLSLDFRDITAKGLAFDRLEGSFAVTDGDVFTRDLTLRGSAAEIGIAGHTNLRTRSYDQTAAVTGQLGASLGVAGALAAGPAFGAALLLFSQVFNAPLQGITRGYYRITGPWESPTVLRIDAAARREADAAEAATGPAALAQ